MTQSLTRKLLMPALLASLIAPLSLAVSASADQRSDVKQQLFEQAGIDQQTRDELQQARQDYREAMMELRTEHREKVEEILGEDGQAALEKAKQEMREEQRAEQRAARDERIQALFEQWELSDDTRGTLEQQLEQFRSDAKALKDKAFESPQARRDAWKALVTTQRDALSEHLDDEQMKALGDAMRSQGRGGPQGG
ncbi:hypothetical protein OM427_08895 [Halomonas sp. 18H]|uniref:hypothetical protein n=1 Tax=Halomonas almeriensis TaxID=308163 RepID=UPI00222FE6B3|nr:MULTISPECIES: hypothetical protein [Halomonas]MCW4149646.1 hypothetical protein [Halomonas sp. 18H]MDN3553409.1 hypothetical protein [Halomonas almeriensis]